ncbi:MAG: S8 family peptidase [Lachnospiraceae bacterium]|nr:S8 family peptidase [Lachnospiraceae bacterium]
MNGEYRKIIKNAELFQKKYILQNPSLKKQLPCIAIIDTGISRHHDLQNCVTGFFDIVNHRTDPYDDNGHGTHIAGIISGVPGIFPHCKLLGIKALNENGNGKVADFIKGTEYVIKNKERYNICAINISLGAEYDQSKEHDELIDCVEYAWDSGITVCAAAGNNGPEKGSITVPGVSKKIITVGTFDDHIPIISPSGTKKTGYSGQGPTKDCIIKPDILCPGANIFSLNNSSNGYSIKSGTSMSTPMITASVSLVSWIHPDITPKELKKAVKESHLPGNLKFDSAMFFSKF